MATTFCWTNYNEFRYRLSKTRLLALITPGVIGVVAALVLRMVDLGIFSVALLLLPVPITFPWQSRLSQSGRCVIAKKPAWFRNQLFWALGLLIIMVLTGLPTLNSGPLQINRLTIAVFFGLLAIAILVVVLFRERGPVALCSDSVVFGNGRVCDFARIHLEVQIQSNQVPVLLLHDLGEGQARKPARLLGTAYQLNFNSLASTVIQLQKWCLDGRKTSSAEIMAMLTVDPPVGVEIGESVQLTIPVVDSQT